MSARRKPILTYKNLVDAEGGHKEAEDRIARGGLIDKDAFLDVFLRDVDLAIRQLEADAPSYENASEDLMTRIVVAYLNGCGYKASSDTNERGHVDVHVSSNRLNLKWNGEAKKHGAYDYAAEGIRQLLTRYTSGMDPNGGFLLYVFNVDAASVLAEWRKYVVEDQSCQTRSTADDPVAFRFRSTHRHSSGIDYVVRHHIVLMHFNPQDKSGRRRKGAAVPPVAA
jgi:hypothetical protein